MSAARWSGVAPLLAVLALGGCYPCDAATPGLWERCETRCAPNGGTRLACSWNIEATAGWCRCANGASFDLADTPTGAEGRR